MTFHTKRLALSEHFYYSMVIYFRTYTPDSLFYNIEKEEREERGGGEKRGIWGKCYHALLSMAIGAGSFFAAFACSNLFIFANMLP